MIPLLILGVASIIGYFAYINLPNTKFQKAIALLKKGNTNLALQQLLELQEKHDEAGLEVAKIKFAQAKQTLHSLNFEKALRELSDVLTIRPSIRRNSINTAGFLPLEKEVSAEIAKIHFKNAQDYLAKGKTSAAVNALHETIRWSNDLTSNENIKAHNTLANIDFKKGISYEKSNNFRQAISEFQKALTHFKSIPENSLLYDIKSRIQLCKLKNGEAPDDVTINLLARRNSKAKKDLMFRLAYYYAQKNDIEACMNILNKHFSTSNNEQIIKLRTYCKEYYAQKSVVEIDTINNIIYSDDLAKNESLYKNIEPKISTIIKGFPALKKELNKIKSYIFSKLIKLYFNNNKYEKVLSHISSYKNFYEEPDLLKNAGIACLHIARNQNITVSNYKEIVSIWLTSVHSDKVLLHSLESTSWDDDYTFTLIDSIGSKYAFANDIENVNFDEKSDDNISIGDTQRELVHTFETLLTKIPNNGLLHKIQSFYDKEKDALEKIIDTIRTEITYVPPYFAKKYKLNDRILDLLSNEFKRSQDIEILDTGLLYVKRNKPLIFTQYQDAMEFIESCQNYVSEKNTRRLKTQYNQRKTLNPFPKLQKSFEEQIIKSFDILTEKEPENELIIPLFEEAIKLCSNKEQIKYQCATFITNLCIAKVNDEKMNINKALTLLIKAFKLNSENTRVAQNLAIITKINCIDMLNGSLKKHHSSNLEQVKQTRNNMLTQYLRNELATIFNDIMNQIRRNDREVVTLFESHIGISRSTSSIFDSLFPSTHGASLNADGLVMAEKLRLIYQIIK